MKFRLPLIAGLFGVPAALLLIAVLFLKIAYLHQEKQAAALLTEIRSLNVGRSTTAQTICVVSEFGGVSDESSNDAACIARDSSYRVVIANNIVNKLALSVPALRSVAHPRGVLATFLLKGGTLCYVQFLIETQPLPNELLRVSGTEVLPQGSPEARWNPFQTHYRPVRLFEAQVTSTASSEQKNKAFDFDLSCLGKFEGCRAACELMPSAWWEYQSTVRKERRTLPPEEMDGRPCKSQGIR